MSVDRQKPSDQGVGRRGPWRVARWVVFATVAWLVCRTWLLDGLVVPMGIPSGSMAHALLGPHCRFTCPECGQVFLCDAALSEVGPRRACPRCGDVRQTTAPLDVTAGDRVVLFRSAFAWRAPRRWEVVAFRDPSQPSRLSVKRVVGLPGESVRIRDGDVYIDGRIARKELAAQRALAVPVHETPDSDAVEVRWKPGSDTSGWSRSGATFVHEAARRVESSEEKADGGTSGVDWLVYHHRQPKGRSTAAGPVTDETAYNQWRARREEEIRPVADLTLRFRASRLDGDGWLVIQAAGEASRLEAWIRPATGEGEFRFDGHVIRRERAPLDVPIEEMDVVVSFVDRQLILAIDGREVVGRLTLPSDRAWHATARPLAIGTAGRLGVTVEKPRIARDVYYGRPTGVLARWGCDRSVRLGPDEFFVLGDNSAISEDSRSWPSGAAVPGDLLIGKPLVAGHP